MMNTMRDLLVHELRDLLSAEHQVVTALPMMVKAATAPPLATAFRTHRKESEEQVTRLEECLHILTGVELAAMLGEEQVANLLDKTLAEEQMTDRLVGEIANNEVNPKAMLSSEKVTAG